MALAQVFLLVFMTVIFAFPQRSEAAERRDPRGSLTLRDALAVTLLQNPELEAFSWAIRATEARVLQAAKRPNPEASLEVEDVLGSGAFKGAREAQITLQLAQLIELGGKRSARIDAAERARDLSSREFEAARVEIMAETTRRFIQLLARQSEVALARENLELSETTLSDVRRRVAAGADSPLEQKKAATVLARARIEGEHAEHQLRVARHRLAAMWGSTTPLFERADGDLFARTAQLPPYETLLARLESAPEILRGLSETELREAEIDLADAQRIPNLALAGGPRWHEGPDDNSFVFGLVVPLPLMDRNQGGSLEARARLRKSEHSAEAAEVRLRALLFGLYQELVQARMALDAFNSEIVPGADDSLTLSRKGFAQGRFSYLELADAQRTLVEVERERIETAASYHEFVLEIERILGAPIDGEAGTNQTTSAAEKVSER